jgi:hypothetical protein
MPLPMPILTYAFLSYAFLYTLCLPLLYLPPLTAKDANIPQKNS